MRFRFWLGLAAVFLLAAGSVAAALAVRANEDTGFERTQHDEAVRSARQAQAAATLSLGELSSAAAFFQAEGDFSRHEFDVVTAPLLSQSSLAAAAFVRRVPRSERRRFEREHGFPIVEAGPNGPPQMRRAGVRPNYFPLVFVASGRELSPPLGYDLGTDPKRAPFLRRARDAGRPAATSVMHLLIGGTGLNVYRPVYRDGAPTATVAQRRAALLGFAAGAFRTSDLAAAAASAVPRATSVQLLVGGRAVIGPREPLNDSASAPFKVADRTWLLVIQDPNHPDVGLPVLMGVVGVALAALLGALILVWSRNERMQELQHLADHDSLTGLKNRRRFEEDLHTEMARAHREERPVALLLLDLDNLKEANDTLGHSAGDRMIVEVAGVLRSRMRETDVLARIGGDEFAIALPHCDAREATVVAEAIGTAIRGHAWNDDEVRTTASIGIVVFEGRSGTTLEALLSRADTALYAAKAGGRDGFRIFEGESPDPTVRANT
jgi:diguanylate cyclase (GGDEF)-like protein